MKSCFLRAAVPESQEWQMQVLAMGCGNPWKWRRTHLMGNFGDPHPGDCIFSIYPSEFAAAHLLGHRNNAKK